MQSKKKKDEKLLRTTKNLYLNFILAGVVSFVLFPDDIKAVKRFLTGYFINHNKLKLQVLNSISRDNWTILKA